MTENRENASPVPRGGTMTESADWGTAAQPRIARFDFVSDRIYAASVEQALQSGELRGAAGEKLTEIDDSFIPAGLAARRIPVRATAGSAGYDFFSPMSFRLVPGDSITVPTGVRCAMNPDWILLIGPKSGKGARFRMMLRNTLGFIDSDYWFSDNEGQIVLKLINDNYEGLPIDVAAGDSLVQGIFVPYGVTVDDAAVGARNGGFGSTVK